MKIATWNINGIKARLPVVVEWLKQASPDIVCFQEIKSVDEAFPREAIEELGYNLETHGQKGFNGVAIASRFPFEEVNRGLPGDDSDEQARFIEGVFGTEYGPLHLAGLYLPNGNPVDSEKLPYKWAWMDRLHAWATERLSLEEPLILAGDYNVIPQSEDCWDPKVWEDDALALPETRARYRALCNLGFTDALRSVSSNEDDYTFWDYQAGAWPKNHGIRIDHLLLSPEAAPGLSRCEVDVYVRDWEKPSDHVPVWIDWHGGIS